MYDNKERICARGSMQQMKNRGEERPELRSHRSGNPWSSQANLLVHLLVEGSKGAIEHASELLDFLVEGILVGPRLAGVEDVGRNILNLGGDGQAENVEVVVLILRQSGERAVVDGVDDGTSVFERAARAGAVLATDPTGVDEPAVGVGGAHPLGKHSSVS